MPGIYDRAGVRKCHESVGVHKFRSATIIPHQTGSREAWSIHQPLPNADVLARAFLALEQMGPSAERAASSILLNLTNRFPHERTLFEAGLKALREISPNAAKDLERERWKGRLTPRDMLPNQRPPRMDQ